MPYGYVNFFLLPTKSKAEQCFLTYYYLFNLFLKYLISLLSATTCYINFLFCGEI